MTVSVRQFAMLATCILLNAAAAAAGTPVSVPMHVEGGRPYIDVQFSDRDGDPVTARAWLDTGGGALVLTQRLADQLGLVPTDGGFKAEGENLAALPLPTLSVGGRAVQLQQDAKAFEVLSNATGLQGTDAEAAIPVRLLRGYDVVFDYPAGTFSLGASGGKHAGTELPVHFGENGMPTVTVTVDGKPYGMLLDTGGTCVMLSDEVAAAWLHAHKDWRSLEGAYGFGDMLLGAKFETRLKMLDVPALHWGPFQLEHVVAVSRPGGVYETNMSKIAGADIVGSLGGNVFRHFRIDIDYPAGKLYLAEDPRVKPLALDMVGVMLEPAAGGGYDVAMLHGDAGGIAVGDHLDTVDGLDAARATIQQVFAALSGKPGAVRRITVRRDGKPLTFQARVQHLLGAGD
ncbi:MAG TPA: aspartyl protease family protein [Gammaproteobacteria bacterium]|nr:aspartyl protease family protein [Gammaproteobacteria bacterium]